MTTHQSTDLPAFCKNNQTIAKKALFDVINSLEFVTASLEQLTAVDADFDDDWPNQMTPTVTAGLYNVINHIKITAEQSYAQSCAASG